MAIDHKTGQYISNGHENNHGDDFDMQNFPKEKKSSLKSSIILNGSVIFTSMLLTLTVILTARAIVAKNIKISIDDEQETVPPEIISEKINITWYRPEMAVYNIAEICSIEQLYSVDKSISSNNFRNCMEVCQPGACCLTKELRSITAFAVLTDYRMGLLVPLINASSATTCRITHPYICTEYDVCKNLFSDDAEDLEEFKAELEIKKAPPYPPHNLNELCSTPNTLESCKQACIKAACCTNKTCTNPSICSAYASCDQVLVQKQEGEKSDDKFAIESICSIDKINNSFQDKIECEVACYPANCCFLQNEKNCRTEREKLCLEYQSCSTIMNISNSDATVDNET